MSRLARFGASFRPLAAGLLALAASCATLAAADETSNTASITLPGSPVGSVRAAENWRAVTEPEFPGPSAGSPTSAPSGLMWKATLAKNTVYLVGSLHAASPDLYPLPRRIEAAFHNSSVLIVEVDINRVSAQSMTNLLSSYGMYPAGDSLWNHLSSETRQLIESTICSKAASCDSIARFKPWALALFASRQPTGMSSALGIDKHFLDRAPGHLRIEEMETAELQIKMFAGVPEDSQERLLVESIRSAQLERQYLLEVQAAWLSGDARRMENLMNWAFRDSAEVEQAMLGDRNTHMTDVVEEALRTGRRAFAVMGAFHLLGPDGVVRQLQDRGYRVEQVFSAE